MPHKTKDSILSYYSLTGITKLFLGKKGLYLVRSQSPLDLSNVVVKTLSGFTCLVDEILNTPGCIVTLTDLL